MKEINYFTFVGCSKIENIDLPDSLKAIYAYSFGDCSFTKIKNTGKCRISGFIRYQRMLFIKGDWIAWEIEGGGTAGLRPTELRHLNLYFTRKLCTSSTIIKRMNPKNIY